VCKPANAIVVFADLRGSSEWTRRMITAEDARHTFMMTYDKECLFYKGRTGSNFYKRLGDGRMFVHELTADNESSVTCSLLIESLGLAKRVNGMIGRLSDPRPKGFRIRLMAGTVINETYPDGEEDWVGYVANTCHRLLSVAPEYPCVIQKKMRDMLTSADIKKNGFLFTLLPGSRFCPNGVEQADIESLYSVSYRRTR
jgi:hypothetical protein